MRAGTIAIREYPSSQDDVRRNVALLTQQCHVVQPIVAVVPIQMVHLKKADGAARYAPLSITLENNISQCVQVPDVFSVIPTTARSIVKMQDCSQHFLTPLEAQVAASSARYCDFPVWDVIGPASCCGVRSSAELRLTGSVERADDINPAPLALERNQAYHAFTSARDTHVDNFAFAYMVPGFQEALL